MAEPKNNHEETLLTLRFSLFSGAGKLGHQQKNQFFVEPGPGRAENRWAVPSEAGLKVFVYGDIMCWNWSSHGSNFIASGWLEKKQFVVGGEQELANVERTGNVWMFSFQTRPLLNMFPATCCFSFPRVGQERWCFPLLQVVESPRIKGSIGEFVLGKLIVGNP